MGLRYERKHLLFSRVNTIVSKFQISSDVHDNWKDILSNFFVLSALCMQLSARLFFANVPGHQGAKKCKLLSRIPRDNDSRTSRSGRSHRREIESS